MEAYGNAAPVPDLAESIDSTRMRLTFRSGNRTFFVRPEEIDWVEAEGNYVRLHGSFGAYLVRGTMTMVESALRLAGFCRIHRSALVNGASVRELRRKRQTGWVVLLRDGTNLSVTPRHRRDLRQILDR